ncbi:N-acetylneuraminate epimerase [Paraburkholderia unamae]|uniref:N-acetylneuraminate epimerase n=1 Tax=Paraburkholderia unamae TaxID=219649 RepID=UPI000DC27E6D|nr:N-acetylneuraminate epimerase [Paraburkholderia unamae]RAR53342.1 N-acetylneuraminate epimerase [Paraburkholderia unamae]
MQSNCSELASLADTCPEFPVGLKNGAGARMGSVIYAGLGSAGTQWYALDLAAHPRAWRRLADFPGGPREQSGCAVVGGKLYVFGGAGQIPGSGGTPDTVIHCDVHEFDPAANRWRELNARSPRSVLGAACVSAGARVLFFGGVNKTVFETLFRDLKAAGSDAERRREIEVAYFSQRPEDYRFADDVLCYEPAESTWRSLGKLPLPAVVGAAVAFDGSQATLIHGELKPGLRSRAVNHVEVAGEILASRAAPDIVAPPGESVQEGLAGAFAGYSNGALLAAGGANFPGAWEQYGQGRTYAHQGLQKTWRDVIYALVDGRWEVAGQLPQGRAYGLSIPLDDSVLLLGGEGRGGEALRCIDRLRWDGRKAHVTPLD